MKRNEPTSDFSAHLFTDEAIGDATPGPTEETNLDMNGRALLKVESLCNRVHSYGPFRDVAPEDVTDDDATCGVCRSMWAKRRAEDGSDTRNPKGSTPENGGVE